MLSRLQIANYAIISELDTVFGKGLNIITGETGAGKSIVAGALGLILGDRADSAVLLDKTRKCVVEGVFNDAGNEAIRSFFAEHDIEPEQEIILRREISANGKSRAFINDSPVNLSQLQKLAAMLVDLHRQFDTLELGQDRFQLEVLDALAGQLDTFRRYTVSFRSFTQAQQRLLQMQQQKAEALREYDYHQFLLSELEEASFREGELEELETELQMLSNAEQVTASLARAEALLDGDEQSMARELKGVLQSLDAVSRFSEEIRMLTERLRSVQIEVKDIASEVARISNSVSMDEKRLATVNDRLNMGYRLLKKHNVQDTAALLQVQLELSGKVGKVMDLDSGISLAEKEMNRLRAEAGELAGTLTRGRKKLAPGLEKKLGDLLAKVGMPNARVSIEVETGELGPSGADKVEFLFDANKSNRFEPLRKVASGGELSRLLLCVKTLVAGSVHMPVLIFDEIDTGISGEAARQVGILMKEMGRDHQVISITHQPQIAARADQHFFVYKHEEGGAIRTRMKKLEAEERVESIARMMAGEKLSHAALQNARELISAN